MTNIYLVVYISDPNEGLNILKLTEDLEIAKNFFLNSSYYPEEMEIQEWEKESTKPIKTYDYDDDNDKWIERLWH